MNDIDDIISGAVAARADGAPIDAPEFESVLAARQDRLRRRTALAAGGLVVAGLAGIGLFATAGDESPGVGGPPSTTLPTAEATSPAAGGIWYCVGRLDDPYQAGTESVPETTIIVDTSPPVAGTEPPAPSTTPPRYDERSPEDDVTATTPWPAEDSGYYEHCTLVTDGIDSIDGGFGPDGLPLATTTTISPETSAGTVPVTTISEDEARAAAEARQEAEEARRRAETATSETATSETVPTTSVESTEGG